MSRAKRERSFGQKLLILLGEIALIVIILAIVVPQ